MAARGKLLWDTNGPWNTSLNSKVCFHIYPPLCNPVACVSFMQIQNTVLGLCHLAITGDQGSLGVSCFCLCQQSIVLLMREMGSLFSGAWGGLRGTGRKGKVLVPATVFRMGVWYFEWKDCFGDLLFWVNLEQISVNLQCLIDATSWFSAA